MTNCVIQIKDEVNVKIQGLDPATRRVLEKKLKFFQPHAYHTPAYKLGRWDGCISFFSLGGATYLNLLDRLLPTIMDEGYSIQIEDLRPAHDFKFQTVDENFHGGKVWPLGHPRQGELIVMRDYQVEVCNKFANNLQCIQEIATGAGKTIMTATLSTMVEPYGRSIVIVPNKDLVRQTEEDYANLGLDVGVYFGDKKELNKTHTIATWQSLMTLEKRYAEGLSELSLEEFADGIVCVIVDEVHMAKADVLKKLLTGAFSKCAIRWGLTGTVPKEDHERISLVASIGDVIHSLSASTLQDAGVLANCHVNIVQLQDTVEYPSYQEELTYLTTNKKRINYMSTLIQKISESGNVLVLVDRIKAGEMLVEGLDDAVFVSGTMNSKNRKTEYDDVKTATNKIIVATYGVAAVGINIPRIFNLVLLEPGKSFVRVIQSIGRGIRKADDKDFVQIWDFTSSAKFAKRHLTTRKKYYQEAKYPYKIEKVEYK